MHSCVYDYVIRHVKEKGGGYRMNYDDINEIAELSYQYCGAESAQYP